ncbi:MAG: hypothetical protein KGD65_11885, partial [Candidatus Lokiarchaeota archaeon]|nr:hypothetical protein [Candidatus Lokiarchaeota archaeon]
MKNAKNRIISILILLILSFVGLMSNNSIDNTNVNSNINEKSTPTLSNVYKILGHTYDFEDETEGQDPTGETLSTNEAIGCTANIENLADGQQQHLSLYKFGSTGRVWVRDNFSHFGETYTAGEYHVKVYHDNSGFGINLNSANGEAILAMVWDNGEIRDNVGGTLLATYILNQWLDVIIYFNLTLGWMFDLDGVRYGDGYSIPFFGPFTANAEHIWITSFISAGGDGYFRVDDIFYYYESENLINILSPVNKTYTKAMSGYYPATNGFEDQKIGSFPIGWIDDTRGTTSVTIFPEKDGHKMVLRSFDADTIGQASATVKQNFAAQVSGTVEFWVLKEAGGTGSPAAITLRKNESSTSVIDIKIDDSNRGAVFWDEGTAQEIGSYSDDQWFHIRFDFDCISQKYDIYIDGVKEVDQGDFLNPSDSVGSIVLSGSWSRTGVYYIDALGYSWDPNYNIGENMEEGLLVSFDTGVPLHTMSYSLDNHLKKSILGDTVIPMPENGLHHIQIFG